jgi:hypothetical protein
MEHNRKNYYLRLYTQIVVTLVNYRRICNRIYNSIQYSRPSWPQAVTLLACACEVTGRTSTILSEVISVFLSTHVQMPVYNLKHAATIFFQIIIRPHM